jgi:IMP dehydrogenase
VPLSELIPTQGKVYADELEGRRYELERGLAEPLVVIDTGRELLLADGHHRVKAASRLDVSEMDAYVIVIDDPVELGMAKTAEKENLDSIADIDAVDYAHHPLVETTHRLKEDE